jgi:CYTH domain-containing protein/CHAD domain-containing protein
MEIERKFLVDHPPQGFKRHPHRRLAQGYIVSAGDDLEVRLRKNANKRILTVKRGGGRARDEYETPLDRASFDRLWARTGGRVVEKIRYAIPLPEGLIAELDVYAGALDGLVTVEVEFDSSEEAEAFAAPPWFGPELTEDARYKAQRLAEAGRPGSRRERRPFSLRPAEPLGVGVRRIVVGQVDHAIDHLSGRGDDPHEAVHEARKSFKRVRAALRLARDELGEDVYRREAAAFRDAGRSLSTTRDRQVLVATLDALCTRYTDELPPSRFARLRAALEADLRAAQRGSSENGRAAAAVIGQLEAARERIAGWRFEHEELAAIAPAFERVYRRGRRAVRAARAEPSDERFHELRKTSQDLWHAAQILESAARQEMKPLIAQAHRLSDFVGDDHDLAVLAGRARGCRDCFDDEAERGCLEALIARRRRKLGRRALSLGTRIYHRRPKRMRAIVTASTSTHSVVR